MSSNLRDRQEQARSSREDEELRTAFLAGEVTRTLAVAHKRTPEAIRSCLKRPGLISAKCNAPDKGVATCIVFDRNFARGDGG